jgi:hypothetical protein
VRRLDHFEPGGYAHDHVAIACLQRLADETTPFRPLGIGDRLLQLLAEEFGQLVLEAGTAIVRERQIVGIGADSQRVAGSMLSDGGRMPRGHRTGERQGACHDPNLPAARSQTHLRLPLELRWLLGRRAGRPCGGGLLAGGGRPALIARQREYEERSAADGVFGKVLRGAREPERAIAHARIDQSTPARNRRRGRNPGARCSQTARSGGQARRPESLVPARPAAAIDRATSR